MQCEQFTATQRTCSRVVTPVQPRLDYTQTRDYSVQNFHFQCLKAPRIVLPNLRSTPVASLLLRLHWLPVTSRKKIQTGNYYLQISSTTNLPASVTSAASTSSTIVRVVRTYVRNSVQFSSSAVNTALNATVANPSVPLSSRQDQSMILRQYTVHLVI